MNVVEMKDRRRRVDRVHHIVEAAIAPGIEDRPCVAASAFSSNSWRHFREVDSAPA
jgi:flagellar biosynthesis regulator FlaF